MSEATKDMWLMMFPVNHLLLPSISLDIEDLLVQTRQPSSPLVEVS